MCLADRTPSTVSTQRWEGPEEELLRLLWLIKALTSDPAGTQDWRQRLDSTLKVVLMSPPPLPRARP